MKREKRASNQIGGLFGEVVEGGEDPEAAVLLGPLLESHALLVACIEVNADGEKEKEEAVVVVGRELQVGKVNVGDTGVGGGFGGVDGRVLGGSPAGQVLGGGRSGMVAVGLEGIVDWWVEGNEIVQQRTPLLILPVNVQIGGLGQRFVMHANAWSPSEWLK